MVDHGILLKTLGNYGIRNVPLKRLFNYLSDKQQYVNFQNTESDKMFIKRGVPQGSILDPLMFLGLINDLHNVSNMLSYISFADDSNLLFSGTNFKQILKNMNEELENKANLRDLITATGLVILLKLDSNRRFFGAHDLQI